MFIQDALNCSKGTVKIFVKKIRFQINTVKMNMLYLIKKIVATDYKQYY